MKILHLHLKTEYWEQIRDGSKPEEYRLQNKFWDKRLENREYDLIYLYKGYPKRGDMSRTLIRKWKGYKMAAVRMTLFGGHKLVYAIDVTAKMS